MLNRKHTIIIALIAIFVLGTIILHADTVDIKVSNIYRYAWGDDPVSFFGHGSTGAHDIDLETGSTANYPNPWVYWDDVYCGESMYICTATQDNRWVGRSCFTLHPVWKFTLPGQWEPIPDDPPAGN